jgi:hypothetical protein
MRDEAIGPSLQINPQKGSNAAPIHAAPFTVPTPQHSVPLSSKVPPLCTIVSPRSFYIRFAKFTLLPFAPPGSHPQAHYNVHCYQSFTRSTLMVDLASHM